MVKSIDIVKDERGLAYLAALFMIVLLGLSLMMTSAVYSKVSKRDKEEELLFRGQAYQKAIESYMKSGKGNMVFPMSLEVLLKDKRVPGTKRHIRKLYLDPVTGEDFEPIKAGNQIIGVRSKSKDMVIKKDKFPAAIYFFEGKTTYNEWKFVPMPKGHSTGTAAKDELDKAKAKARK